MCVEFFYKLVKDHPRLRGDYSLLTILTHSLYGSPPLTRGLLMSHHRHR